MFLGANLIPESFEIGEPVINATASIDDLEPYVILAYAGPSFPIDETDPQSVYINNEGGEFNGISNSVGYNLTDMFSLRSLISYINNLGYGDGIISVFTIPKLAVKRLVPSTPPGYFVYPLVPRFYTTKNNKNIKLKT